MPTSVHTHDYDGELRQKWFEIRPMLLEKHLPESLPFQDTLEDIRSWLNSKYTNVKRFKRAHRSVQILETQRHVNFDNKNEINVEELLPILWSIVKKNPDLYDTFYEQLCDITGGSCSQGRSTRLFQFLFLFDTPQTITTKDETINSTENGISSNIDQEKQQPTQPDDTVVKDENVTTTTTDDEATSNTTTETLTTPNVIDTLENLNLDINNDKTGNAIVPVSS